MPGKKFPYRAAYVACAGDGSGKCSFGCNGCGKCAEVCKCGAVSLSPGHAAKIDREKCRACGLCVKNCPQGVIRMHDDANRIVVACSNTDPGAKAKEACAVSCTGCGLCAKTCTAGAVSLRAPLAQIDEQICLSCGMCAVRCPRHAIRDMRGILTE